jgi:hypothetical protein
MSMVLAILDENGQRKSVIHLLLRSRSLGLDSSDWCCADDAEDVCVSILSPAPRAAGRASDVMMGPLPGPESLGWRGSLCYVHVDSRSIASSGVHY